MNYPHFYYNGQHNRAAGPPPMMNHPYAALQIPNPLPAYNPIPFAPPQRSAPPMVAPRQKKILAIVDPNTNSLVNAQQLGLPGHSVVPVRSNLSTREVRPECETVSSDQENVQKRVVGERTSTPTCDRTTTSDDEVHEPFVVVESPKNEKAEEDCQAEQTVNSPESEGPEGTERMPESELPIKDRQCEVDDIEYSEDSPNSIENDSGFVHDSDDQPAEDETADQECCMDEIPEDTEPVCGPVDQLPETVDERAESAVDDQPVKDVAVVAEESATTKEEENDDVKDSQEDIVSSAPNGVDVLRQRLVEYRSTFNAAERVYDRKFVGCVGDYVEKSNHVPCLLTEEYLTKLGLDRRTMPAEAPTMKRKKTGNNTFGDSTQTDRRRFQEPKKTFQTHSNARGQKYEHFARNKHGHNSKEKDIVFERKPVQPIHHAEKAWKPALKKAVDEVTKTCKDIRGLLNKVTPTTIEALTAKFLEFEVYKDETIRNNVLRIIFEKAVEEPRFCPIYSDLCKAQVNEEIKKQQTTLFRNGILNMAQATFEGQDKSEIADFEAQLTAETDEEKKTALADKLRVMKVKEKRRVHGNIGFIGELFRHQLITTAVVNFCIIHLVMADENVEVVDEPAVECAVKMLTSVGKSLKLLKNEEKRKAVEIVDKCMGHLSNKAKAGRYCARIRFMIVDLVELKSKNWVPRKAIISGPKTVQEIHDEAENEEMENKAEREEYDQRRHRRGNIQPKRDQHVVHRQNVVRPFKPQGTGGSTAAPPKRTLKQVETNPTLSSGSGRKWGSGASSGQKN